MFSLLKSGEALDEANVLAKGVLVLDHYLINGIEVIEYSYTYL